MVQRKKKPNLLFWAIIGLCLLVSVGQISITTAQVKPSDLIISEIMAANGSGLVDEDGDYSDWIEIYNRGSQPVNLAGWSLTNDPSQPTKWPFPDITLGSRQYLVIFASGKNRTGLEAETALHTNFRLNKDGDFLGLHNVLESRFIDEISPQFPAQLRDISYGRYGPEMKFGFMAAPTPGGPNEATNAWAGRVSPVIFSVERGLFDAPFAVELSTETDGAAIRYTTDGSEPTATNGQIYSQPIPVAATTLLRAAAFKPNFLPSTATTQSYIFLDTVLAQPAAPAGFPANWNAQLANVQGQLQARPVAADYEMDPEIVNNPIYGSQLKQSLTALPVVSLVMEQGQFTQLYTHPTERGRNAEQPVSIELIYPDDSAKGLQANAGLRLYGEVSETVSKRSFQLFFRSNYGPTRLEHPLFNNAPVETFNTLLLKAGVSPLAGPNSPDNLTAYTRNEWLRQSQIALSGLGAHGIFAHVYINGLYWGVYNLTEKPDAAFMSSYIGGADEEWFVANHAQTLNLPANSQAQELDYLFTTLNLAPRFNNQQETPAYLADTFAAAASRIDPVQFSDYVILYWYAVAQGWPVSNWTVAIHPQDAPNRGRFLIEDESLNRLTYQPDGLPNTADADIPQLEAVKMLFKTFMQDPDFQALFADRLYKHLLQKDGGLTDEVAQARWQEITTQIEPAIIAESARWGDLGRDTPFTLANWQAAQNNVRAKISGSAANLIAMAREAGYYPNLDPPIISHKGGLVETGFTLDMSLTAVSRQGDIYYTINGLDPRMSVTGDLSPDAVKYNGPITITENSVIRARVFDGENWSALNETSFSVVKRDTKLRLTEIMYNPSDGDDYEFIELTNLGVDSLSLANMAFVEGIRFIFPPDVAPLPPGESVVLVRNAETFAQKYGNVPVGGVYDGSLSNKGETLTLIDSQSEIVIDLTYNDADGWPISPDGRGDSLVLVHTDGNPNNPGNWRASHNLNGSPGVFE